MSGLKLNTRCAHFSCTNQNNLAVSKQDDSSIGTPSNTSPSCLAFVRHTSIVIRVSFTIVIVLRMSREVIQLGASVTTRL